ncbi:hypothetical protein ABAC460_00140 [Asticcacaulis sp. AC460]|nr:hypothetical protein ABAC460_00140 [Asticcacaulis sp. AC460]
MGFLAFWRYIWVLTSVVLAASGSSVAFATPRSQQLAYFIEVLSGVEGDDRGNLSQPPPTRPIDNHIALKG